MTAAMGVARNRAIAELEGWSTADDEDDDVIKSLVSTPQNSRSAKSNKGCFFLKKKKPPKFFDHVRYYFGCLGVPKVGELFWEENRNQGIKEKKYICIYFRTLLSWCGAGRLGKFLFAIYLAKRKEGKKQSVCCSGKKSISRGMHLG